MLPNEKINRINELSRKAKAEGLTEAEAVEQKELRAEYLRVFRQSVTNTLHSVKIVDPNGTDITPEKLKRSKNKRLH